MNNIKRLFLLALMGYLSPGISTPCDGQESTNHTYTLPGDTLVELSEKLLYKTSPQADLYMYLLRPEEKTEKLLPAIVYFFGGGWVQGAVSSQIANAAWFRDHGIIGITVDYRVNNTHGTSPMECVKDAKSAVRFVRQHANKLGIDPNKIIVAGGSAGGHIAASTCIDGADEPDEDLSISSKANALVLHNPVLGKGYGDDFFALHPEVSPILNINPNWPPAIISCGTEDVTTPYDIAKKFTELMNEQGNVCELITVEGQKHSCDWPVSNPNFLPTMKRMYNFLVENQMITPRPSSFTPGQIWPDNNGIHMNAHGGGILFHDGVYYWYGEHKIEGRDGNKAQVGVHVYSSKDLYNWTDEGIAMTVSEDENSPITKGCIIERPKVIYNRNTKKFVLWFHLELKGQGYTAAKTGVAIADLPSGPFTFIEAVNPNAGQWPLNFSGEQKSMIFPDSITEWSEEWLEAVARGYFIQRDFEKGQMARDMALFVDDDGKAYHIHAAEENLTIHISELNDDYTGFSGRYTTMQPAGHNEAPALFKKDGKYYMITSGCTGWAPNAARSFVTDHIMGEWNRLGNPVRGTEEEQNNTFNSQSTFIIPVQGKKDKFIFMADRWAPKNPIDGRYIWLPVEFENGKPIIKWYDEWDLSSNL